MKKKRILIPLGIIALYTGSYIACSLWGNYRVLFWGLSGPEAPYEWISHGFFNKWNGLRTKLVMFYCPLWRLDRRLWHKDDDSPEHRGQVLFLYEPVLAGLQSAPKFPRLNPKCMVRQTSWFALHGKIFMGTHFRDEPFFLKNLLSPKKDLPLKTIKNSRVQTKTDKGDRCRLRQAAEKKQYALQTVSSEIKKKDS